MSAVAEIRPLDRRGLELAEVGARPEIAWIPLSALRVDYSFSPRVTLRSLFQYNSDIRELNSSIRFHYIYRPGSDFYLVYNDLRLDTSGVEEVRDRQLVFKVNFLLSR